MPRELGASFLTNGCLQLAVFLINLNAFRLRLICKIKVCMSESPCLALDAVIPFNPKNEIVSVTLSGRQNTAESSTQDSNPRIAGT